MADPQQAAPILNFRNARELVLEYAAKLRGGSTEGVSLFHSLGRVLASSIVADRDLPPFARATRDGFAVRAADVQSTPALLQVVGEVRAGAFDPGTLPKVPPGCAVEIMTGAPVPEDADSVVMVEHTSRSGDALELQRAVQPGDNIVPRGAEAAAGQVIVEAGTRVDHITIALAASVGCTSPSVFVKPRIAVLSTGDEIVDIGVQPGPHQIRNSNSYSLAAQIVSAGAEPVVLPVAPDEPQRLRELISEGLRADLLLLSGGVSMGKYDFVEQVLAEFDANFLFTGVAIQPGKPLVFGDATRADGTKRVPFFGLPGNPVSTTVTFELFVRPVIQALCGARPLPLPFTRARLAAPLRHKQGLTRFLPAALRGTIDEPTVELVPWQGSGDLVAMARSNCYIVVPSDREEIAAGEYITVLLRGMEL